MTMVQKLKGDLHHPVGGAQRDAGDDAGQGDGQHQQQRHHLLAEEAAAGDGPAARVPSTMAASVASPATSSDSWMARHTSGRLRVTSNHLRVSPGAGTGSSCSRW